MESHLLIEGIDSSIENKLELTRVCSTTNSSHAGSELEIPSKQLSSFIETDKNVWSDLENGLIIRLTDGDVSGYS